MKKLIIILLVLSCTPEEPFSILGEWEGINWYCSNEENCVVKEEDKQATAIFQIRSSDSQGILEMTEAVRYQPSCDNNPNCTTGDWEVELANYVGDRLYIRWTTGHEFTGYKEGNIISGEITYSFIYDGNLITYVWNDEIEIRKI